MADCRTIARRPDERRDPESAYGDVMPHFDLLEIIRTIGYVGVFLIIFAESGLFVGFFFPGDSLLFTAGFLASSGVPGGPVFSLPILIIVLTVAAITGVSVGYWTGDRFG